MNEALSTHDPRLPAIRARLFLLIRSLWKTGVLQLPLTLMASDRPALGLLPPLWQRLRVELLGEPFVREILPPIEHQMASGGRLHRSESHLPPNAPIDWAQTWRRNLSPGAYTPIVTRRWLRELDLHENQLALLCLHEIAQPIAGEQRLLPEERGPLTHLRGQVNDILNRPPWRDLTLPTTAPNVEVLRERVLHRPAYLRLIAWWIQWQAWRQPTTGNATLPDPDVEPSLLFELLVLFEIVTELARHYSVRQYRPLAGDPRAPAFIARTPSGPLYVYYQTGTPLNTQRSLDDLYGIPDIVLRLPGTVDRFVIVDAKNYGPAAHAQALYKMLGYLYQYGYAPDGSHRFEQMLAGVLVFPTEEKEGTGLRNWQKEIPNSQSVLSFVLPPTPDEHYTGLAEFGVWLKERV